MACNFISKKEEVLLAAIRSGDLTNLKNAAKDLDTGKGLKETILQTKDAKGRGALHLAAAEGKMHICQYLIEELGFGLLPDVGSNRVLRGQTPLHCAAGEGRIEIVKYLIDAGADPNFSDLTGTTPLFLAVGGGHSEVVELLLSKGVRVDPESWLGTPLILAATCNQEATMEILLNHNANVNTVTSNLLTPLKISVTTGSLNCTRLLIKAGADVNLKAPIVNASEMNSVEILMCLLEAGADPNVPDIYGRFAIEAAAMSGNMGTVQMLFPITSQLPNVADWTLRGVFSHVKSKAYMKKFDAQGKKIYNDFKRKGDDAFRRKDYYEALCLYSPLAPIDATVCANRSFCWLHVGDPQVAITDARLALTLKPDWPEAHYRLGAGFMSLKDYKCAFQALLLGFKLDPQDKSIEKALREAAEGMKKGRA